jgi:Fe-S cluster assembly protein SufD
MAKQGNMKQEQALQRFQSQFEEYESALNGTTGSPAHLRRKAAMDRLSAMGFPTLRDEDWRYTNLNSLLGTEFVPAPQPDERVLTSVNTDSFLPDLQSAARLVFVDGQFVAALSTTSALPTGVRISDFATAYDEDGSLLLNEAVGIDDASVQRFTALNHAFANQGAVIQVSENTVCEHPVHLLFLSSGGPQPVVMHPRIIVQAAKGSEITVIEQYEALNPGIHFTNTVVEIVIQENAHVHHYKLQNESPDAFHVSTAYARIPRSATYSNHYFGFGAKLTRNNVHTVLDGETAECTLNGLFLPMNAQHMDHHTLIDHASPHCNSHELYKGILLDDARGVFSGKIVVRKDAQKTDAKQASNNLLLSKNAVIDTKPQLEIWADDVKCTHGATIGRMDEEALFYLRSRGVPLAEARNILSIAFASELVSRVSNAALREHLDSIIHHRLEASWKSE